MLLSRIAASVTHAPVQRVKLPKAGFAPIGGCFPTQGKSVADLQANVSYVGREIHRWRTSYAILHDETFDLVRADIFPPVRSMISMAKEHQC